MLHEACRAFCCPACVAAAVGCIRERAFCVGVSGPAVPHLPSPTNTVPTPVTLLTCRTGLCERSAPSVLWPNRERRTPAAYSKRTNKQTNKRTNEQTNEQTNKRTNKRTNKQTNEQTNERTNKQTNRHPLPGLRRAQGAIGLAGGPRSARCRRRVDASA